MSLKNFRASDFKRGDDDVKMVRSKRDRSMVSEATPTTTPIVAADANPEDVPSGTVPEILSWVGEDLVRAQKALDVEVDSSKPRKGLVETLSEMISAEAEAQDSKQEEELSE